MSHSGDKLPRCTLTPRARCGVLASYDVRAILGVMSFYNKCPKTRFLPQKMSKCALSSYLYFWTLWILLCRYFVRRRRKLFYENVFWKTRSTFPKWVRGVQNTTPHDKTIHETRELRLDTPCPPTDTGSMPQHTRARAREKKHSASWVVR